MTSIIRATARGARSIFQILHGVSRDYSRKGVSMIAAALAFYLFVSLFPFLLVLIAALGYILRSSQESLELVRQALAQALPSSHMHVEQQLQSIIIHIERQLPGIVAKRAIVGSLGLVGLVWSASGAFTVLVHALRIIWETPGRSRFLPARARAMLVVILAVALLLISMALSSIISLLSRLNAAGFSIALGELRVVWRLASGALPLAISFITFLAVYRIVPATRLKLRHLAVGAAFAAVAWEIAKCAFSYYLTHFANFKMVYGPVAAIVVLLIWIYISAIITLVGAELAWVYAQRRPA